MSSTVTLIALEGPTRPQPLPTFCQWRTTKRYSMQYSYAKLAWNDLPF